MTEEYAKDIMNRTSELWSARGDDDNFVRLLDMLRDEKTGIQDIFYEAESGKDAHKIHFNFLPYNDVVREIMCKAARRAMIKVVEEWKEKHHKKVVQLENDYMLL